MPKGFATKFPKVSGTWYHMHDRVEKHPTYKDVEVCDEWFKLSKFVNWMEQQDYNRVENSQLDKDIPIPGSKIYSPQSCIFVSPWLNKILTGPKGKGATFHKGTRKWYAQIRIIGEKSQRSLGYFDTLEEARDCHCKAKSEKFIGIANNLTEKDTSDIERTREGLIQHARLLLE